MDSKGFLISKQENKGKLIPNNINLIQAEILNKGKRKLKIEKFLFFLNTIYNDRKTRQIVNICLKMCLETKSNYEKQRSIYKEKVSANLIQVNLDRRHGTE